MRTVYGRLIPLNGAVSDKNWTANRLSDMSMVNVLANWFLLMICAFVAADVQPVNGIATGRSPQPQILLLLSGGDLCQHHSECFSGHCYETSGPIGVCAPDAASNGTVAAGGDCLIDADCFSNYCADGVCSSDSPLAGYVAGGGSCADDDQCYSGVCYDRRCSADGAEVGRTAAGGYCRYDEQCYSRFCRSNRCGPDSRVVNVVPSGGHCSTVVNWCWSKVCYDGRCTAAGVPGKVADGGLCRHTYHCLNNSFCKYGVCVPNKEPAGDGGDDQTQMQGLQSAGERCDSTSQCTWSFCVDGYCAPPSPSNRTLIADGGRCDHAAQCHSGQCEDRICATSYADHKYVYLAAAGASCSTDNHCYSGVCAGDICSAESPAPLEKGGSLVIITASSSSSLLEKPSLIASRGSVAGGGFCRNNEHCYSAYCRDGICAADGPAFGTVADGGECELDQQCFSGYCRNARCIASRMQDGRVAPGAACDDLLMSPTQEQSRCAEPYKCAHGYCAKLDYRSTGNEYEDAVQTRRELSSLLLLRDGPCWRHAQCRVGRCLYKQCTAPWYVSVREAKPPTTNSSPILIRNWIMSGLCYFCIQLWLAPFTWTYVYHEYK